MCGDGEIKPASQTALPSATDGAVKKPTGHDYTDGRKLGEWKSKYPEEACRSMNGEALILIVMLLISLILTGICLGAEAESGEFNVLGHKIVFKFKALIIFFAGWVGGVTFSIKWLIHSVAKGMWHCDRKYWRLLVPSMGGIYACVVITLFGSGMVPAASAATTASVQTTAALAFMVGYFSDGVSGLLSNIANAVFGTLEKK